MSSQTEQPKMKPKAPELIHAWGTNSLPPTLLCTLIVPLHTRPLRAPILFVAPLLFSSYVNLAGYTTDAAAMSAAWSGLYALLAMRRRQEWTKKFTIRGGLRGLAVGLGAVNFVCGGWVWLRGDKAADKEERETRNRWG
ncbi:uncharacterized protein DNG_06010 [Cephalotrichum gorgonifer]|uniref:Uncharacterized protein n=1 Tax=Cephalotrichum gorgonifer TaxID=2041049 RepID=A0AAE8SW20_9PEZI|nr:uncharacterized protein DNG_06010 [Cephalotrichum gorgonifer]